MFFALLREWIIAPIRNYQLFENFTKQDFLAQFSGSIFGFLWLFITPVVNILIYSFVFGYVLNEFQSCSMCLLKFHCFLRCWLFMLTDFQICSNVFDDCSLMFGSLFYIFSQPFIVVVEFSLFLLVLVVGFERVSLNLA